MTVIRIVPNLPATDPVTLARFYAEGFDLEGQAHAVHHLPDLQARPTARRDRRQDHPGDDGEQAYRGQQAAGLAQVAAALVQRSSV